MNYANIGKQKDLIFVTKYYETNQNYNTNVLNWRCTQIWKHMILYLFGKIIS